MKTDLFFNLFMIQRRLNELFEDTLNIFEFSRIALEIIIDVLINLIVRVSRENNVIVC